MGIFRSRFYYHTDRPTLGPSLNAQETFCAGKFDLHC